MSEETTQKVIRNFGSIKLSYSHEYKYLVKTILLIQAVSPDYMKLTEKEVKILAGLCLMKLQGGKIGEVRHESVFLQKLGIEEIGKQTLATYRSRISAKGWVSCGYKSIELSEYLENALRTGMLNVNVSLKDFDKNYKDKDEVEKIGI